MKEMKCGTKAIQLIVVTSTAIMLTFSAVAACFKLKVERAQIPSHCTVEDSDCDYTEYIPSLQSCETTVGPTGNECNNGELLTTTTQLKALGTCTPPDPDLPDILICLGAMPSGEPQGYFENIEKLEVICAE